MTFTESNTVEALVRDILCGGVTHQTTVGPGLARRRGALSGLGWHYLGPQQLPRQAHEVLVEDNLRDPLIRLNPEIAAQPDRADDVLYRLRAILMGVRTDGAGEGERGARGGGSISGNPGGRTTTPTRRRPNGSNGPSRRCFARTWSWTCSAATQRWCSTPRCWTRCSARPTPTGNQRRSRSRLPTACADTCTTPASAIHHRSPVRQCGARSSKYARRASYRDASFPSPASRKSRHCVRTLWYAGENCSRRSGTSRACSSIAWPSPSTMVRPSASSRSIERHKSAPLAAILELTSEASLRRFTALKNSTHLGPTTIRGCPAT